MKNNQQTPFKRALMPLVIFFVIINAMAIVFRTRLEDKGVDTDVVIIGNLILFIVSCLSVWMYSKASGHSKGHGVVKNVYGGFMLKFFALVVTAMVYFYFAKEINKPAIFICMGIYLVYNFSGVLQLVKKSGMPHAERQQQTHHQQHPHHK